MIVVSAARRGDFYLNSFYIVVTVRFGKQILTITVKLKRGPLRMRSDSETTSDSSFIPVGGGGITLKRFSPGWWERGFLQAMEAWQQQHDGGSFCTCLLAPGSSQWHRSHAITNTQLNHHCI